jgi:hypothetical protein
MDLCVSGVGGRVLLIFFAGEAVRCLTGWTLPKEATRA